jgi:hypothetical protein
MVREGGGRTPATRAFGRCGGAGVSWVQVRGLSGGRTLGDESLWEVRWRRSAASAASVTLRADCRLRKVSRRDEVGWRREVRARWS